MMDFSYTIHIEQPEPEMAKLFATLLPPLQSAMAQISHEHSKLKEKYADLQRQNEILESSNQGLKGENTRLSLELAHRATAAASAANAANAANANINLAGGRASPVGSEAVEDDSAFVHVKTMKIHNAPVHSVTALAGSPTEIVATASWDETVKLYSLSKETVVATFDKISGPGEKEDKMKGLYSVAFAKTDPGILGCTSCDNFVYLWSHKEGRMLKKLKGHTDEVNGIDFHETQQVMCTASDDKKAIIWDFQEGMMLRQLDKHTKGVYGCTFLGCDDLQYMVATCSNDKITRIFDMRDKTVSANLKEHEDEIIGIDYSGSRRCLATGSDDGHICLFDVRTWRLIEKINTKELAGIDDNEVKRVAFSPSGDTLAAGCGSGQVLVFDVCNTPARLTATLGNHQDCVFDVAWGVCAKTGSRILVSASHDHSCSRWRERG